MESGNPSGIDNRAAKAPTLSVVLGSASPGTAIGSRITATYDWLLDQRALLQWADDGGRWVGEGNSILHEVRT